MIIDSKESLNNIVRKFRENISEYGDIKFNSSHQLFARMLGYKSQAALLNDLPVTFYGGSNLDYEPLKTYFPYHIGSIKLSIQYRWHSIFEPELIDIDEVIMHHRIGNIRGFDHDNLEQYFKSKNWLIKNEVEGRSFSSLLSIAIRNNEISYAEKLIDNCYSNIDILKSLTTELIENNFDLLIKLIKKQSILIDTAQNLILTLLINGYFDKVKFIIKNKIINLNALISSMVVGIGHLKIHELYKMKEFFLEQGGRLKVDYHSKDNQIKEAYSVAIQDEEYKEKINLLNEISHKDESILYAYLKAVELPQFTDKINFISGLVKSFSDKGINSISEDSIRESYSKAIDYNDWEDRLEIINEYFKDHIGCLRFLINLPEILNKQCETNKELKFATIKGIYILSFFVKNNYDFNQEDNKHDNSWQFNNKTNISDSYLLSSNGLSTDLFVYLHNKKVIKVSKNKISKALKREADWIPLHNQEEKGIHKGSFQLLQHFTQKKSPELQFEDIVDAAIQHAYRGNGLALKYLERNYNLNINFVFNEFSRKNILNRCTITTKESKLIPLLIKGVMSTVTRRQCLSYSVLSYLGLSSVEKYLDTEKNEAHLKIYNWLKDDSYNGSSYSVW